MTAPDDFATTLRVLMTRARCRSRDLAALTGISLRTIENWRRGAVRSPQAVLDLLKVASALTLDVADTDALLLSAGHPSLAALQAYREQSADVQLRELLANWPIAASPAAPAATALRHQLRPPVADFVGRDAEIDQLIAGLHGALAQEQGAIISGVQGMGGIGKTELSNLVAQRAIDSFPDAQIVLTLRGSSAAPMTPEQAVQTVIRAFTPDAQLPGDLPTLEAHYRALLYGQRMLILADDVHDAAQVRSLIPPLGSALLITSRQRFTLPGMVNVHLEQLPPDAAVSLIQRVCPRLGRADARQLAQLCGYLPLALRVSGSILHNNPALSIAIYLQQLTDERQRLVSLRDPDDAQLDVAASLALSYAQLDALTQRVFRQLGVILADFAAPLGQAVVDADAGVDVEAMLHRLLRRNLIMYDAPWARWRLHDLVHDLAMHALDAAGEREATTWRYAHAAARIAQETQDQYQAGRASVMAALARFDAERPHIDAAHRWATEQAGTLEGDQLLLDLAAATRDIGELRYDARRERIPLWESMLAATQRLRDRRAEGHALNNLGNTYAMLGEIQRAIAYHEQLLILAREMGDRQDEAIALGNLGVAYRDLGDIRRAILYYDQALAIAQEIGDRRSEGIVLSSLGFAYTDLGEARRAIPYYQQYLTIAQETGDRRREGMALGYLGLAHANLGEARRAIPYYEQCLAIVRALGDQRDEGYALHNLGNAYLHLGDVRRAIECCEESLTIACATGDRRMEGYALSYLARAQARYADLPHAITTFTQAVAVLREVGDRWGKAECNWLFGLALVQQGERERALPLLRAALAYEEEIGHAQAAAHAALLAGLEAGEPLPAELSGTNGQRVVGDNRQLPGRSDMDNELPTM